MSKIPLVKPDKSRHEYVVGIDFGHGETSAAYCKLEWDKDAGQRESAVSDIEFAGSLRVLPSAISITPDGREHIGSDAFRLDSMTSNTKTRVCFKQCPEDIKGEPEQLMIAYMRAVYAKILEKTDKLKKGNHIVYIARPSGWKDDEVKDLYKRMAIAADIPLGGLTSESRAAIFYAMNKDEFRKNISRGGIVFDLGSSTLDFTYLTLDDPSSIIDDGEPCGASLIEQMIFEQLLLKDDRFSDFLKKYPACKDALLFKVREEKEAVYNRIDMDTSVRVKIDLEQLSSYLEEKDAAKYEDVALKLKFSSVNAFNDWLEQTCHYKTRIKEAIKNFQTKHLRGKEVYGVYLAGGATRMNFLKPLVAEMFQLSDEQVKSGGADSSLVVSRGIALLGTVDAIVDVLRKDLEKEKMKLVEPQRLRESMDILIENMAGVISETSWSVVHEACLDFKRKDLDKKLGVKDLEGDIRSKLEKFSESGVLSVISGVFNQFFQREGENVRKELNKIICKYAPGQEIKNVHNAVSNISLDTQNISDICMKHTSGIISKMLWAALGIFLFGIFSIIYQTIKYLIYRFKSEESRRKDICHELEKNESKIKAGIKTELVKQFSQDASFVNVVSKELETYLSKLIQSNIDRVKIAIE